MVQIVPESNSVGPQVAVGTANVDSEAITADAIDAGKEGDINPANMPSGFAASEFADSQPDTIPSAVPPDWQSERTQRSRQIGLIVALSLTSLLGAVLLFSWFVRAWQQSPASDPSREPNSLVAEATDPHPDVPEPTSPQPITESPVVEVPDAESKQSTTEPDSTKQQPAETDRGIADQPGAAATETEQTAAKSGAIPSDLLPQSPIDPLTPDAEMETASEDASKLERLPDGLQKFVPDLNFGGAQPDATLEAPPTLDQIKVEAAAEEELDPMLVATLPEPINMRRALAIEFALSPVDGSYPLSDLILTVSQITGVPIQIDWVSFDLVGIGIRDEVPTKKGWNSAKALLDSIAESVGGVIEQDGQMLTLSPSDATKQEKLGALLDLSDFADGKDSATQVLNQFLPSNDLASALEQEPDQQKLAALAVEAMRRIRGITPKVSEARFRRWAQPASDAVLEWPILSGGSAGPPYDAPLAMAGFLRRTARANQATCFVNWLDANRRRMSPAQLTMPFTEPAAGIVITNELKPFGLQVRKVDANHWWVGTEATYDRFPVIVWTEPLGPDRDVLTQRLTGAVESTDGELFRIAIDSQTGCGLLLLPRYLVRQLPKINKGLNLTKAR